MINKLDVSFTNDDMLKLQNYLIKSNQTITCAESCTGGLISSYITQNSGSSAIFKGSIITYCNETKEQELGVKKETMIKHGVVSREVAKQMCKGVLEKFNADAVFGYRFLRRKGKKLILHDFGNMFLSFVTSLLFLCSIPDMETGYKLIKRKFLEKIHLRARRFEIEPEITAKLIKQGCKIKFIPIEFEARSFEEGKKIRVWDGFLALFTLLKFRNSSRL